MPARLIGSDGGAGKRECATPRSPARQPTGPRRSPARLEDYADKSRYARPVPFFTGILYAIVISAGTLALLAVLLTSR